MSTELEEFRKQMLRRARLTSIVLGLAAVVTVLFMIYGFTQSIEAGRERDIALEKEQAASIEALNQKEIADSLKRQLAECQSKNK